MSETAAITITGLTDKTVDLGHTEVNANGHDNGILIEHCHNTHIILPRRITGGKCSIAANHSTAIKLDRHGHSSPCDMRPEVELPDD